MMMKRTTILFFVTLLCQVTPAQIKLTQPLVDSLITKVYNFEQSLDPPVLLSVIKFSSTEGQEKSIFVSATTIMLNGSIRQNMMIYKNQKKIFLLIFNNVSLDTTLRSKLIQSSTSRFRKILDSLRFGEGPFHGLVPVRTPLTVYRIKKRLLCKNRFVITSKKYIPYLSAPEAFIPIKKFAYGGELDEIEPWYYDAFGNLNDKYYEDLKPEKKIIIKLPKKK